MAKQQIFGAVRVGDIVYQAGQEEQLAKVLSADQIERLTAEGVIAGFSSRAGKSEAEDNDISKGKSKNKS